MCIHQFLEVYSFEDIFCWHTYLVKILEVLLFFLNRKFGEYLCKMPPKKRSKRRGSQETERISTRTRSPEVDELSCVPETLQTQQAAGVEELVLGVEDPLEMSNTEQVTMGWRHSTNRIQVMTIYRIHKLLQVHRRARSQARARLTKGARNPQFSSVLSRNRS